MTTSESSRCVEKWTNEVRDVPTAVTTATEGKNDKMLQHLPEFVLSLVSFTTYALMTLSLSISFFLSLCVSFYICFYLCVCVCVCREIQFCLKIMLKTHTHTKWQKFEAREHKRITFLFRSLWLRSLYVSVGVCVLEDGFVYRISGWFYWKLNWQCTMYINGWLGFSFLANVIRKRFNLDLSYGFHLVKWYTAKNEEHTKSVWNFQMAFFWLCQIFQKKMDSSLIFLSLNDLCITFYFGRFFKCLSSQNNKICKWIVHLIIVSRKLGRGTRTGLNNTIHWYWLKQTRINVSDNAVYKQESIAQRPSCVIKN